MTEKFGLLGHLGQTDLEQRKTVAWGNASPIQNSLDRFDCDGRIMCWNDYGKMTQYGWEIDHAIPTVLGGPDVLSNLRARHWQGNRSAGGILGGISRFAQPASLGILGYSTASRAK